jgi:hypothetical protein
MMRKISSFQILVHWFKLDVFFAEAKRVLKPTGALALVTYDLGRLDNENANTIVEEVCARFFVWVLLVRFRLESCSCTT